MSSNVGPIFFFGDVVRCHSNTNSRSSFCIYLPINLQFLGSCFSSFCD